jgi:regulator of replication initiation timing
MNRVIRPAIRELYEYHQTLYIIYHKLYPEKKYDEISGLMDKLVEEADAILKYPREKLKKRLGDKIAEFDAASTELYKATVALKEALAGSDPQKKDEAVQQVHARYQNLDSVFE